jgi:glycosyltransferase involved in cell wall biosynthesis
MATLGDPLRHLFRYLYKSLITPIIKKRKLIVIRTQNDDYVERHLGIPLFQSPWISVGSDLMLFKQDYEARKKFRGEYGILDSDFVIVYTGKLIESKGGGLLAEAFEKKFTNSKNNNTILLIVGNIPQGEYGDKIKRILSKSENKIIYFHTQKYAELAEFYQGSDLVVYPKQCSLSFYDSQACGLPVVSEDNNINIDRLQSNNGFNFKSGDVEDFRRKILQCIEMDDDAYKNMRNSAENYVVKSYNYEDIVRQYMKIFTNIVEEHRRLVTNDR